MGWLCISWGDWHAMQIIISIINYNKTVYLGLMQQTSSSTPTTGLIKPFKWSTYYCGSDLTGLRPDYLGRASYYYIVTTKTLITDRYHDELGITFWKFEVEPLQFTPLTAVNWFIPHSWSLRKFIATHPSILYYDNIRYCYDIGLVASLHPVCYEAPVNIVNLSPRLHNRHNYNNSIYIC